MLLFSADRFIYMPVYSVNRGTNPLFMSFGTYISAQSREKPVKA